MKVIMEFGTYHTGIRILLKNFNHSFKQSRGEFSIIINNEQIIAFRRADTNIVASGEAKVSVIAYNFNIRPY